MLIMLLAKSSMLVPHSINASTTGLITPVGRRIAVRPVVTAPQERKKFVLAGVIIVVVLLAAGTRPAASAASRLVSVQGDLVA